jgi:hypothetical protein
VQWGKEDDANGSNVCNDYCGYSSSSSSSWFSRCQRHRFYVSGKETRTEGKRGKKTHPRLNPAHYPPDVLLHLLRRLTMQLDHDFLRVRLPSVIQYDFHDLRGVVLLDLGLGVATMKATKRVSS